MGLGNYDDAAASAQWMLNLQPFNVPGLLIAADLRQHYGDLEGALEVLDRAYAETSPDETGELASIANHIAAIEIDMGKLDSASQMLQRADELFPGYPETVKNRARVGRRSPSSRSRPLPPCPRLRQRLETSRAWNRRHAAATVIAGGVLSGAGRIADSSRHRHRAHHSNHAEPGAGQLQKIRLLIPLWAPHFSSGPERRATWKTFSWRSRR